MRFLQSLLQLPSALCILTVIGYAIKGIRSAYAGNRLSFSQWIIDIKQGLHRFAAFFLGNLFLPVLLVSFAGILITNTALHQLVGIHNLSLKPDGTYCFYVEAQREGGKSYVLPAQLQVYTESFDTGEGTSTKRTDYYIEKIFFSDGGHLDTNDGERDHIGETSYFFDDSGDEWGLTLLNQHAYTPYVTETNNATWFDIALLLIQVTSFSLLLYAWCQKENEVVQ